MDYLKFYELNAEPFQNHPDPRFYYETRAQQHCRLRLQRGLEQRRGLAVVLGPSGCGKTTLATHLSAALSPERFQVHLRAIPHTTCARGWLLPEVSRLLGAPDASQDPARLVEQIHQALRLRRASGLHWVLMLDEAQVLSSAEVMQELRSLLNLETKGDPLLSIVLLGLTELREALEIDASLGQRVDVRVQLEPMDPDETASYVAHRLRCAGSTGELFAADAVDALLRLSRGVPRVLNTLADNALFEAFLTQSRPVGAEAVIAAADQLGLYETTTAEATVAAPVTATEAPPAVEPAPARDARPHARVDAVARTSGAVVAPAAPEVAAEPESALEPEPLPDGEPAFTPDEPGFAELAHALEPEPEPEPEPEVGLPGVSELDLALEPEPVGSEAIEVLDEAEDPVEAALAFELAEPEVSEVPEEESSVPPGARAGDASEPEATQDEADALFESLLGDSGTAQSSAASSMAADAPADADGSEDDELIDMAQLLEVEDEPDEPSSEGASAGPRGPVIDGDLDDLFEQIQLED